MKRPRMQHIWHILPKPCLLRLFSPRRRPPSVPSSAISAQFCRCLRIHDVRCRQLEPRQPRHDAGIPTCPHFPGHGHEALPPTNSRCQRRPGARHLPGDHGASCTSWLPSRTQSCQLLRQQLLHCIRFFIRRGTTSAGKVLQTKAILDRHSEQCSNTSWPSVMGPLSGMVARNTPKRVD